jgi:Amt family ammonium transporter
MSQVYEFDLVTTFNQTGLNISAEDFKARNPNDFYLVSSSAVLRVSILTNDSKGADMAWMMTSSALVLLMVPGLGLFYSGISEKCSALSMMWLSMMTTSLVGVQV